MDNEALIRTLSVLGQETRLGIYRLLCEFGSEGACPSDIAEKLGVAAATLSFHLKTLTQAGLLDAEADGRFIRYRANHQPTRELVRYTAKHLCGLKAAPIDSARQRKKLSDTGSDDQPSADQPAQQQLAFSQSTAAKAVTPTTKPAKRLDPPAANPAPSAASTPPAPGTPSRIRLRPVRILFLSQGNAARSILAESITNQLGQGRFIAFSAGSQPLGRVNRYALKQLDLAGCPVEQARSKSWEEFSATDAPEIDLLIALWAEKSAPTYPQFHGRCQRAYWPTEDPSAVTSSVHEAECAFAQCYEALSARISPLLKRLADQLDKATAAALS